jgi:endoglucanase
LFAPYLFLIINNFWNSNMQKIKEKWSDVRRVGGMVSAFVAIVWLLMTNTAMSFQGKPGQELNGLQIYPSPETSILKVQGTSGINHNRLEYSLISSQPHARWFSEWNPNEIKEQVRVEVGVAVAHGKVPVLVIYNIYKRDCISASLGGAQPSDPAESITNQNAAMANYYNYIQQFAIGIEQGLKSSLNPNIPVIVLLEPDSLALQSFATINGSPQKGDDGCADFSEQYLLGPSATPKPVVFTNAHRNTYLHVAVNTLSAAACYDGATECPSYLSRVKVYLDGGHSNWGVYTADKFLVDALVQAGIQDAAGIFTNVSNYQILGDPISSDQKSGELPYGRWLLDKVEAKIDSTYPCATGRNGVCTIPFKRQIVDVSRSGFGLNLSSSADQGNGWPAWCDNVKAAVGQIPTLNPKALPALKDAYWLDGLLWVKPPGETDGCFGNGKTNHAIARGVPNPLAKDAVRAGTFSLNNTCMLLNGSSGFDSAGNPILNDCEPIKNLDVALFRPNSLRIAYFQSKARGDAVDEILLEWEPSPGACHYQVMSRIKGNSKYLPVYRVVGDKFSGPATSIKIRPEMVDTWRTGKAVQYTVRARNCGRNPVWSELSNTVTTRAFP